jgi:hypothetical protein
MNARDQEYAARSVADGLEAKLRAGGISFQRTAVGMQWERASPNTEPDRGGVR